MFEFDRIEEEYSISVNAEDKPTQLKLGRNHSCAQSESGKHICWGSDQYGQIVDQ